MNVSVEKYHRYAIGCIRKICQQKGRLLTRSTEEDLASETLLIYYEKKAVNPGYIDHKPIAEISRNVLLRHFSKPMPTAIQWDELLPSPEHADPTAHAHAINFIMDTFTPTQRKIAELFLRVGGYDRELIAELAETTPDNVSNFLYQMKIRVQEAMQALLNLAVDEVASGERSSFQCILSLSASRQHSIEMHFDVLAHLLAGTAFGPPVAPVRDFCTHLHQTGSKKLYSTDDPMLLRADRALAPLVGLCITNGAVSIDELLNSLQTAVTSFGRELPETYGFLLLTSIKTHLSDTDRTRAVEIVRPFISAKLTFLL